MPAPGTPGTAGGRPQDRQPGAVAPATAAPRPGEAAERVIRLYQRLGLPLDTLPAQAVITPACGLAGASPAQARAALTRCREAGSMLAELIEETGEEPR